MQLLDFEHDSAGNLIGVTVDYEGERIELERVRHGEWVAVEFIDPHGFMVERLHKCSLCHEFVKAKTRNYCPNCGAKMDGGKQDD